MLGDYDNDGDIDIYIVNLDSPSMFIRNNKGNQNNWLTLNLVGHSSNKDGIGSRIKLLAGGKMQTAQKKKYDWLPFTKRFKNTFWPFEE